MDAPDVRRTRELDRSGPPVGSEAMAQPATDAANEPAANGEAPEKHEAKPPTRLVLVRHGVTAHTGPLLSGRMPGIDLSDKGVEQAEAAADRISAR